MRSSRTCSATRQRLSGDEAKEDLSQTQQVIRQVRMELEDLLQVLRR